MASPKTPTKPPFWHPDPPPGFAKTIRFDRIPGSNPLKLLFERLPSTYADNEASWDVEGRDRLDRAFVFVLWGFANSDRDAVVSLSNSREAGLLWDVARDAFTLEDPTDLNKTKNYFLQGLAQLLTDNPSSTDLMTTGPVHSDNLISNAPWGVMADWIAMGRVDTDSLGTAWERHTDRNELEVIKAWTCYSCEARIQGQILYCGFCGHPEYAQMNGVRYCSEECQKIDWREHKEECSQRRFFFRGCEIFKYIAHDFQVVTYTKWPRGLASHVDTAFRRAADEDVDKQREEADEHKHTDTSCPSISFFTRLAWDQPDIYAVLRPLISNIFKGLCQQVSILKVYMRNARDVISRTHDISINPGCTGTIKEKQPMFHPHSVLYLRIKTGEEFIIDLHSNVFGFATDVIPFNVFIRSRVAGIISITDPLDDNRAEEWAPDCMREIQHGRHELMKAFLRRSKVLIKEECKAKNIQTSICQICHLRDPLYEDIRIKLCASSRPVLEGLYQGNLPYH
ncbi:hypothetical protein B0T11DRAFT_349713 [Plectosphaerella cucumerina]|uniref:MYND-type domain-containing protein n=1 Tax=Plectosphaerella cucumerina TaxID=40658 RepID=A0A8K0X6E2_9PEZI|nr:hypothetical protein B0T11DRAFT_349713 [Plectosphaerella cucumerina]